MPPRTRAAHPPPAAPLVSAELQDRLGQLSSSNEPLPPITILRTHWKWAAFSQFFYTFAQLFAMEDITVPMIESDLIQSTAIVLPRIMLRLLHTLTQDRKITLATWQTALRRQYQKRDPDANPIGVEPITTAAASKRTTPAIEEDDQQESEHEIKEEEETNDLPSQRSSAESVSNGPSPDDPPRSWLELPMLEKLDSMHTLAEWHFQNPLRLRMIMKSNDDMAEWRIEPIGYDSKSNAYWLIGTDRLWIQRVKPKPPKKPSLKRKRNNPSPSEKPSKAKSVAASNLAKRPRLQSPAEVTQSSRPGRDAKAKANQKLDQQARELAELNRQAALQGRSPRKAATLSKSEAAALPPTRGTRTSARLRGVEQEWQSVPDEWLEDENDQGNRSDSESELSELTELSDSDDDDKEQQKLRVVKETPPAKPEDQQEHSEPENFIEWETIAATLYEWEHVAERFEKATHYREKALYKLLVNVIIPPIVAEMKEIERQRKVEEAIVHRKRSSRLAIKESEREEAAMTKKREVEEAERMARTRRAEARQQREEEERIKKEQAREQRRKDREEREARRKRANSQDEDVHIEDDSEATNGSGIDTRPGSERGSRASTRTTGSGMRTPSNEDWELDCEVCGRYGRNLDDGTPLLCCGRCNRWQHIPCHDRVNKQMGIPLRNWEVEEFICQRCIHASALAAQHRQHPGVPSSIGVDAYTSKWKTGSSSVILASQQSILGRIPGYSPGPYPGNLSSYNEPSRGITTSSSRDTGSNLNWPPAPHGMNGSSQHRPQQRLPYHTSVAGWNANDSQRHRSSSYSKPLLPPETYAPSPHVPNGVGSNQLNHHHPPPSNQHPSLSNYPSLVAQNSALPSTSYHTPPHLKQMHSSNLQHPALHYGGNINLNNPYYQR